jgi:DNA-binding winged helix-turn-helix (wHTH) protein
VRVRFGEFTLDAGTRQLCRGAGDVHLSPKAFDLLAILVERRPAVVDKLTLRERLWPGTTVVDANLNNLASEIRAALGDDAQEPRFIRTVHRVGYAFCGDVQVDGGAAPAERAPKSWLAWQGRTSVLADASTIVGRDPECAVWIDGPGVSRRHARLSRVAGADGTSIVIEDLDSTNGTFVEGRRVTKPVTLEDGDVIRIGEVTLTFRTGTAAAPTKRIARSAKRDRA